MGGWGDPKGLLSSAKGWLPGGMGAELLLPVETSAFVSHGRAVPAGLMPALVAVHLAGGLPLGHGRRLQGVTRELQGLQGDPMSLNTLGGMGRSRALWEAGQHSPTGLLSIRGSVPLSYPHPQARTQPPHALSHLPVFTPELFTWSSSLPLHHPSTVVAIPWVRCSSWISSAAIPLVRLLSLSDEGHVSLQRVVLLWGKRHHGLLQARGRGRLDGAGLRQHAWEIKKAKPLIMPVKL